MSIKQLSLFFISSLILTTQIYSQNTVHGSFKETQTIGDIKAVVKTSSKNLLLKDFQPIHFTFTNRGNKEYLLKSENIGLPLLTEDELKIVAKKRFSILPFTALFSAQIYTVGQLLAQTITAATLSISLPIVIIGTVITTAIDQYRIKHVNQKERKIFEELKKGIAIEPYSIRKITLHIKKANLKPSFNFNLLETETNNNLRFNITLKAKSNFINGIDINKLETDKK